MTIWVNTIVNNEENFIWFALMSVVDYVDKILIWDTGSTDKTIQIIEEIKKRKKNKIIFKQVHDIDNIDISRLRQKMLEESKGDWILLVDGDEIWWENSIKKIINRIKEKGNKLDGIVVPMIIPVGDIYHIQEEEAGKYEILGRKGHFNLRAINTKIPGLHVDLPHPQEGYFDEYNKLVQESRQTIFLDSPYLHMTHLKRSSIERKVNKFKHEIGRKVDVTFVYPEVLYKEVPQIVPSPWINISGFSYIKSKLLTPLRQIKRRIF